MNAPALAVSIAAALALSAACARSHTPVLAAAPLAALQSIERSPDRVGAQIYEGNVFPLDPNRPDPLFRYGAPGAARLRSLRFHTRDVRAGRGRSRGAERAAYRGLRRHPRGSGAQAVGLWSSVEVSGKHVKFTTSAQGEIRSAEEEVTEPVVAGPTMFGFILSRWDELTAVAPTLFEFDSASRKILEYSGRVPPLEKVGDKLRALDARVTYAFRAAEFQ